MSSALARPAPAVAAAAGRQARRAAAPVTLASSAPTSKFGCNNRSARLVASPSTSRPPMLLPLPSSQKRNPVLVRSAPADEQATEAKATRGSDDGKDDASGAEKEGNKPQTSSTTTTQTPPPTPHQPPQLPLTSRLRRLLASLAAALVRAVSALASLLGGRELGKRAAAAAAGALFVTVAVGVGAGTRGALFKGAGGGGRAGGAPYAVSAASASSSSPASAIRARKNAAFPPRSSAAATAAAATSTSSSSSLSPAAAVAAVRSVPAGEVPYSQFLRLVSSGSVRAARLEPGRVVFDVVAAARPSAVPSSAAADSSSRRLFGLLPRKKQQEAQKAPASLSSHRNSKPLTLATARLPGDAATLVPLLQASGVEFAAASEDPGAVAARVLAQCLMLWLPLAPLLFLMSRAIGGRGGGGVGGIGNRGGRGRGGLLSRGKGGAAGAGGALQRRVTFADVAGADGAKRELAEAVAALRDPAAFAAIGAQAPSGILLYGPPGTGKTLLAKAVAGEAGVPFFAVAASEFVELYVGRGAARVRSLFADARRAAPCVVFIDELDAVGGRRGGGGGSGGNDERDQTLNQLLTEMDGFDSAVGVRPNIHGAASPSDGGPGSPPSLPPSSATGVLLLAATNRPEVLDPALVRPGRLSRRVAVPLPDEAGRASVLGVHLAKIRLEGGAGALPGEAARLARAGAGLSGAQLADVANDAALLALRRGATAVASADLDAALERVLHGVDGRYGGAAAGGGIARALRGALLRSGTDEAAAAALPPWLGGSADDGRKKKGGGPRGPVSA